MSIFRILKYSSILYFLGKHRDKLARSAAVLLFAFVSSLIYDDVRVYLAQQHPGTLIYALIAKIVIVYGSLLFVLLQFRSSATAAAKGEARAADLAGSVGAEKSAKNPEAVAKGHLDALANVEEHDHLQSRYDRILAGKTSSDRTPR
ncbi:hypothetical protein [Congregibacter sp.]|uniref:hypothetical protein n=1 Tax=Congregibacter sp. TaxID=2744308 RepID=UPI003F6B49B2